MLKLENLSKYYSTGKETSLGLSKINLELKKGEIVAITGDSGAGKSTLLNVITGVDNYDEGEMYFNGDETSYFNQDDLDDYRKKNVSFIYQKYEIIDSYTVLENVMLPLVLAGVKKKDAKVKALELIEKVGLTNRIKNKSSKLSGGEKQRVAIARALALDKPILACDEPTGNLDSESGKEIIELIKEVSKDKLVLIVTHNYPQVEKIVTRHLVLKDGELILDKALKEVQEVHEESSQSLNFQKEPPVFNLAFKNLIRTPKKSLLLTFIFTLVSLISLAMLSFAVKESYKSDSGSDAFYDLRADNRVIVYDRTHQGLSEELLKNKNLIAAYPNAFYEDSKAYYNNLNGFRQIFKMTEASFPYQLEKGRKPQNKAEYVLVIPASEDLIRYDDYYDLELYLDTNYIVEDTYNYYGYELLVGKIVGLARSNQVTTPYVVGKFSESYKNAILNSQVSFTYEVNGKKEALEVRIPNDTNIRDVDEVTTLTVPKAYEGKFSYSGLFGNLYPIDYDFNIIYSEEALEPFLEIGLDYIQGLKAGEFKELYEVSCYAKDLKSFEKDLKALNYDYTIVKDSYVKTNEFAHLKLYLFSFFIILILIGIFFVTYAVTFRIYTSKISTYGIMRSLGMVKKNLKQLVFFETLILNLVSLVLSFSLFIILNLIFKDLNLLRYLNFFIIFSFILINLLFSYFISHKFNKRVFNDQKLSELKGGIVND